MSTGEAVRGAGEATPRGGAEGEGGPCPGGDPAALPRRLRLLAWLPALALMALIFWLSAQSDPLPALTRLVWDKALHGSEYAALGVLLLLPLRAAGLRPWPAALVATLLASLYGGSDEWHQAFVPLRSSDVADWLADTTGAALGAVAGSLALRLRVVRASIARLSRRS